MKVRRTALLCLGVLVAASAGAFAIIQTSVLDRFAWTGYEEYTVAGVGPFNQTVHCKRTTVTSLKGPVMQTIQGRTNDWIIVGGSTTVYRDHGSVQVVSTSGYGFLNYPAGTGRIDERNIVAGVCGGMGWPEGQTF